MTLIKGMNDALSGAQRTATTFLYHGSSYGNDSLADVVVQFPSGTEQLSSALVISINHGVLRIITQNGEDISSSFPFSARWLQSAWSVVNDQQEKP